MDHNAITLDASQMTFDVSDTSSTRVDPIAAGPIDTRAAFEKASFRAANDIAINLSEQALGDDFDPAKDAAKNIRVPKLDMGHDNSLV